VIRFSSILVVLAVTGVVSGCGRQSEGKGEPVRVTVPAGSSFAQVTDSLQARGLIRVPLAFRIYARMKGADRRVHAGTYAFRPGVGWDLILEAMNTGRVLTERLVIPEGWTIRQIAPAIAHLTGSDADSLAEALLHPDAAARLQLPGPTLEGYLYPATYTFPLGVAADTVVSRLVARYRQIWTEDRRARADSIGMDERQVVTLASVVEKEAKRAEEMPIIAAVFHRRLRIGYPLQADATVQYALGEHQRRLLHAHIDAVADNPYNTYRNRGLPPGPIASPSDRAVDAVLAPAAVDYLYFVARPDGSHIFSRSLEEHNRAVAAMRRLRAERERAGAAAPTGAETGTATPPPAPTGNRP
jgi:UPF0755 protein